MMSILWLALSLISANASPVLEQRADNTAVVNLAAPRGPSKHAASGFIYGIPDNSGQIPSHLLAISFLVLPIKLRFVTNNRERQLD